MKTNIIRKIQEWNSITFEDNPYGDKIPDVYLDCEGILKSNKTLRNQKQNGFIVSMAMNDKSKESYAERTNFVIFSPIFNRLLYEEKLCPSNYICEVINELTLYEYKHNKTFYKKVYCGYISRALRAFASYIRELNLQEFIMTFYNDYCQMKGYQITRENDTLENKINQDLYNKTDIYFEIEDIPYRIWSYQSTDSGVKCTMNRVIKSKNGVNLYIPFNIDTKKEFIGWYLYNEEQVISEIKKTKTESFQSFKNKLRSNPYLLKNINKVFV